MTQRLDFLIRKLNRMQDRSGSYKARLTSDDERDIVKHLRDYEHFIEQRILCSVSDSETRISKDNSERQRKCSERLVRSEQNPRQRVDISGVLKQNASR